MLVEKSCGELRYLQYPDVPLDACADAPGNVPDRMAAHFDMDVVTLLHQTPCENGFVSLEAKIGGEFSKVPAIRGTLVVNLGEVIRLLTGGRVKATVHRVVRPPRSQHRGSARDVVVFFQAPPLSAKLRPIVFTSGVGRETIFDEQYRAAGEHISFSQLRARLFAEFARQTDVPDEAHEADAHLFAPPAAPEVPPAA
jgi:isopenicillin N synthase-like dioxygenase